MLPAADWADAYGVTTTGTMTAREAMDRMLERTPGWINHLLALRNGLGRLVGLKAARLRIGAGGFPVVAEQPGQLVLGFDDRHLDFRIVVSTRPAREGETGVSVATLVRRRNAGGRAYLAAILPFHRLIVRRMLVGLEL